ncbi:MAG: AAA family ATPase [Bacteroidetes bacterium]|nr:AAA family ATPase [Bacteroidota bacterium]
MNTNDPMAGSEPRLTPEELDTYLDAAFASLDHPPHEIRVSQLLRQPDEGIPALVEPILQRAGVACLAGSSDTGKSTLLRQLALAVAGGDTRFLGFPIHARHKSVIYVSTEDGQHAVRHTVRQQARSYQLDDIDGLRFIFDYEDIYPALVQSLAARPADLIIIDCFSDIYTGDLKDTQQIRSFLKPYQLLSEREECLILFLHHTGKRTETLLPSKNNLLSGQGLEAKMRCVIELRADLGSPHDRHLCVVKGNYLSSIHKQESFVLHFDEKHLAFTNTGERVPFELLVRQPEHDNSKEKYERAADLRAQGQSYQQIAEALGYSTKSSVSALFAKAVKMGWEQADKAA